MTNFEYIQALWNQQPDPNQSQVARTIIARAETNNKKLLAFHYGTMTTLSATVLLLTGYFWVYGTTTNRTVLVGSLMMIVALLLRIVVEYYSYRRFAAINPSSDLRACLDQIRSFHQLRQQIQFVATPLSLGSYVWGFSILLPYFKVGVSEGFYRYIIVSGALFLVVLCVIIYRQIRNEMRLLAQLKESYTALMET
ncbi:hypothetical protein [Spirosoma linguale]|uniref:Uncharacterized protein n=1 Tax=Spirosoma linguale (strain ATCC 33905 / DSM 74 / LMG 10896 / Claus 1) TaxID=504472 RepID=D2QCV4_SPILD|nr:hypothetical protein Slin_2068 [Spirosoma linguale DSM 74]